jgi:Fe-S-cluster containining protein
MTLFDDADRYQTEIIAGVVALKHKPNGDCVYLGEDGCTIHGQQPYVCKSFDCRLNYLKYRDVPRNQRRSHGNRFPGFKAAMQIGRRMLKKHPFDGE